jgi:hypothetical protein
VIASIASAVDWANVNAREAGADVPPFYLTDLRLRKVVGATLRQAQDRPAEFRSGRLDSNQPLLDRPRIWPRGWNSSPIRDLHLTADTLALVAGKVAWIPRWVVSE